MSVSKRQINKAETQKQLLAAARAILGEGGKLSVAGAAKRAGLSVATGYRYYSDVNRLKSDAALELGLSEGKTDYLAEFRSRVEGIADPVERLLAAQRQMMGFVIRNEMPYRHFIAQGHLKVAATAPGEKPVPAGGRRMTLIEAALEPVRDKFGGKEWAACVQALMLVTGPEPFFILRDFAKLDDASIFTVTEQTIRDVAAAHLKGIGAGTPP